MAAFVHTTALGSAWVGGARCIPARTCAPRAPRAPRVSMGLLRRAAAVRCEAPVVPVLSVIGGEGVGIGVESAVERPVKRWGPVRTALAFAARAAKRVAAGRKKHSSKLKLARMGAGLALAVVGMVVSRGTLSGVATVAAPAMPSLPFKIRMPALPENIATIVKPFTESFGVVFLSEFGDKSMFATALMAMKHSPFLVLVGALAALTVMTFIACFLGQLMHLLPTTVTHYSTIALFVFFGIQMIMQSRDLPNTPGGQGGERADAEELVAGSAIARVQSPMAVLAKVCSLIFVAEWCDRSMLATMALAASSNTVAVIGGATMANIVCTGLAVSAATLVSSRISERMVALVAGILFEFFAVFTYLEGPEG